MTMKPEFKNIILLFFFLKVLFLCNSSFAQKYTVSGYVSDNETGETIIGAAVSVEGKNSASVTDINGYFRISGLEKGKYTIRVSHISYREKKIEITVEGSVLLPVTVLEPESHQLYEVSVVGAKPDEVADKEIEISHHEISPKTIQAIPRAGNDVFAAIKYMPGIDNTEPYSPLFSARGSDPGENAILLDGVMVYNPYHSLSSSGMFNMQTIKNVDLLLGGFGAEYGGRNSSVLYLTTKDGNLNEVHGEIEPSTFQTKGFLEFPAGKNASMMLAGRYNYDIISNFLFNSNSYFYDFNVSYTNRLNDRNRLTVKYFQSKDDVNINLNTFYDMVGVTFDTNMFHSYDVRITNNWINRVGTAFLKTVISPKLYMRTQGYVSSHKNASSMFNGEITDLGAKAEFNYTMARFNIVNGGVEYNKYNFKNGTMINDIRSATTIRKPDLIAFYIEDKLSLGPVTIKPGLRFSNYNNSDWYYEPRINAVMNLSDKLRFKAAWGEYYQYIISMNTSEIELNQLVDYYYPLQNRRPGKSIHYIAGIERNFSQKLIGSLDIYYKDISRVYTFDLNSNLSTAEIYSFSDKIKEGSGKAYGAELLVRGDYKRFSGWMSYALAWSYRKYPHINNGEWYSYEYNRRNTLKTFINYQFSQRVSYSATFTYLSGQLKSIESTVQSFYEYDPYMNSVSYTKYYVSNNKNNARMPAIMNLDFSIIKKINKGFAKKLADYLNADGSYAKVTINNVLFFRRNIIWYFPVSSADLYIPLGDNYVPSVGFSYAIKF